MWLYSIHELKETCLPGIGCNCLCTCIYCFPPYNNIIYSLNSISPTLSSSSSPPFLPLSLPLSPSLPLSLSPPLPLSLSPSLHDHQLMLKCDIYLYMYWFTCIYTPVHVQFTTCRYRVHGLIFLSLLSIWLCYFAGSHCELHVDPFSTS